MPGADRDHAERPLDVVLALGQPRDQQSVALLEDVQRQCQAGEQHAAQREQRDDRAGHDRQARAIVGSWLAGGGPRRRDLDSADVMRRLDLRQSDASSPRDVPTRRAARAPWTSSTRSTPSARSAPTSRPAETRRCSTWLSASTGCVRPPCGCPHDVMDASLAALDPGVRRALETSIERARLVHADQRRADVTTSVIPGGSVTERWVPVRPGRPVRARRAGGLPVQRRDERGAGAGRRRRVAGRDLPTAARQRRLACTRRSSRRARCWAWTRSTPSAARRRWRCSPTATAVVRGRRPGHRAGQHLRHRRQAAARRARRDRLRGRPDRDRDPGRRHRRTRCTSLPT